MLRTFIERLAVWKFGNICDIGIVCILGSVGNIGLKKVNMVIKVM